MRNLRIVKKATKIRKSGRGTGNSPTVWIEVGADPKYSVEAIKRYNKALFEVQKERSLLRKLRGEEVEELDENKMSETVTWFIDYLKGHETDTLTARLSKVKFSEVHATYGEKKEILRRVEEKGYRVER